MPKTFKIVFFVEDSETKELVIEKQQLVIPSATFADRDLESLKREFAQAWTVENLARDHMEEWGRFAKAITTEQMSDSEKETLQKIDRDRQYVDEVLEAAGDLIRRSIRDKLRVWARTQAQQEPAHS